MKVRLKHISEVLANYKVLGSVKKAVYIIEYYEEGSEPRAKVIVRAEMDNEEIYILKFVLEKEHSQALIEEQSIFSEQMRKNGINTPRRLKCKQRHCSLFEIGNAVYAVTVEEYLGEELKYINYDLIDQIASLMARMHSISELNNYHISGNTIWDLFHSSADISRGYKAFCEYFSSGRYYFSAQNMWLQKKIVDLYQQRLARLRKSWPELPRYAVQGDYSINNLTARKGKITSIFDYNLAGDEVLVSDMLIEGLFLSYEMDLDSGLAAKDKDQLFKGFIRKYAEVRNLSLKEKSVLNDIYAVVFPFWWTRIIYDQKESLQSCLKAKNRQKVDQFLEETYLLLNRDNFPL